MTAIDITVATNAGVWHVDCRTADLTPLEKAALDAFVALATNAASKPKAKPATRTPRKRSPQVVEDKGEWLRRKATG